MCKGLVVVYRSQDETTFFVVGSDDENEVILVGYLARAAARTARGLPGPLGMSCSLISQRLLSSARLLFATHGKQMRALGIGSPLLIMSCACLLFVEERGAAWICGSAAHFGCMGRGPLLSCLMTTHAIVGSTLTCLRVVRARSSSAWGLGFRVYGTVGGRVVWLVEWGGLTRCWPSPKP